VPHQNCCERSKDRRSTSELFIETASSFVSGSFVSSRNYVLYVPVRFCIGDRFYLHDNRILCEYDYVEQRAAAAAAQCSTSAVATSSTTPGQPQPQPPRSCLDPPGTTPPPPPCPAAQMKRHAQLQQLQQQQQQQYLHPHPPHQHAATMDGCVNW